MKYKDVMEPCTENHFISMDTSIEDALKIIHDVKYNTLIVMDDQNNVKGILTKANFLDAYRLNIPQSNSVKQMLSDSYEIINKMNAVRTDIFSNASIILLLNLSLIHI